MSQISEALTGNVQPAQLALIAAAGDPRFPEPALQDWRFGWLHQTVVDDAASATPFLVAYLQRGYASALAADGFADDVLELAWKLVA